MQTYEVMECCNTSFAPRLPSVLCTSEPQMIPRKNVLPGQGTNKIQGPVSAQSRESQVATLIPITSTAPMDWGNAMAPHRFTSVLSDRTKTTNPSMSLPIDLTEATETEDTQDIINEDELDRWLQSQSRGNSRTNMYAAYQSAAVSRTPQPPTRNLPIRHPFRTLSSCKYNDILLRPGVCAELQDKSFIRIVDIIQDTRSQATTLRGWLFQRASNMNGVLGKSRNEVCWIIHCDKDDVRDTKVQAMETVPIRDVIRRRKIILTNQPFPNLSFRDDVSCLLGDSEEVIRNERVLVCRFKYICFYVSADQRNANTWSERVLQRLRATDCDSLSAADDKGLREAWRGETVPGGAHLKPVVRRHRSTFTTLPKSIDLTDDDSDRTISSSSTARGDDDYPRITKVARIGRKTNRGVQDNTINGFRPAKRSYDTNVLTPQPKRHQSQIGYERPLQTVSLLDKMKRKCSVVEAKPPRTPRSGNVTANRQYTFNDYFCGAGGMSRAAYQSGLHIQDAFDFDKHACQSYQMNFPHANLHCLWAHEFVNLRYDCKADIIHLSPPCQFFSPNHTRVGKDDEMNTASWTALGELLTKSKPRVVTLEQTFGIVLRAQHQCPGEPLPSFPQPTHSSSPGTTGLLPWTSISSALATIPADATQHDPRLSIRRAVPPTSGDRVARAVTCDGGAQVHPDGTRDYTIREFATLQGFVPEHIFGNKYTRKQIGNALPPPVGEQVLKNVVDALKKEDGIRRV
ncbi:MAG: hypothetical protein Q9213_002717 [Squamulea squamosa]